MTSLCDTGGDEMPLEIIDAIRSAESSAEQKVAEARREAAHSVESAERQARERLDQVRRDARASEKQLIEQKEAQSRAELEAEAPKHTQALTQLREQAVGNTPAAVEFIVSALIEGKA